MIILSHAFEESMQRLLAWYIQQSIDFGGCRALTGWSQKIHGSIKVLHGGWALPLQLLQEVIQTPSAWAIVIGGLIG